MEPLKFSDRELQEVLGLFEAGGGLGIAFGAPPATPGLPGARG